MTKEEYIDTNEYGYDADKGIWSKCYKKFLEGHINKDGYVQVILKCVDGKQRHFYLHRVIWTYFNGAIPEGMQVNHINEIKTDNRLCNLNLMTPKENTNWGTCIERSAAKHRGRKLSEEHKAKLSKQVVALDKDGNVVYEFPSTKEAERNGFCCTAVSKCCRNCYYGSNIYKGYYWYYKEDYLKMKNAVPHKRETA